MYFPKISTSTLTLSPMVKFPKVVNSIVWGISATSKEFLSLLATVKLTQFSAIEPFSTIYFSISSFILKVHVDDLSKCFIFRIFVTQSTCP